MQNHILEEKDIQFSHPCIGFEKTLQWYEQLFFALFSVKLKKGTQNMKRGPKGDPNHQKGSHGDPGPQKETHFVTVIIFIIFINIFMISFIIFISRQLLSVDNCYHQLTVITRQLLSFNNSYHWITVLLLSNT